ncbi:MAG TPA: hypothetical protein VMJ32_03485 [Pirellulales bacterium]|nr:hypothetical protein [Pirellulales bacterium]
MAEEIDLRQEVGRAFGDQIEDGYLIHLLYRMIENIERYKSTASELESRAASLLKEQIRPQDAIETLQGVARNCRANAEQLQEVFKADLVKFSKAYRKKA